LYKQQQEGSLVGNFAIKNIGMLPFKRNQKAAKVFGLASLTGRFLILRGLIRLPITVMVRAVVAADP